MNTKFQDYKVSVVMVDCERLPYGRAELRSSVMSALQQDHANTEVILVNDRGPSARPDAEFGNLDRTDRLRHIPGIFADRATMYNAGLRAASGDFVLLVWNSERQVTLRRSAVRVMVMAAARHRAVAMVYGDYELVDAQGTRREIHLLDWHEGRLRDTVDFGSAWLIPSNVLREVGGLSEKYQAADLYDLRLRLSEKGPLVHLANRYAGSVCTVHAPPKKHDVFDYLLAGKKTQLEMEDACTEHLRRIGSYLAPRTNVKPVEYSPAELRQFQDYIASVVIPVNNRPSFIVRAIESVQRQTVRNIEVVVVVNGGPDDPTADAVRRYMKGGDRYDAKTPPVQLLVLDINSIGLCLNAGISAARGKYYVQLDSDDRLKPDAVEKLLAVYDSDPTIGMVIGSYEVATLNEETGEVVPNKDIPVVTHDEWTADNGRNNLLRINGAGAPRSAHIKVIAECGWFGVNDDPSCRNYGEDYDLVLRISERYTIGRVWEPIYEVIRHSGGTDHSIDQSTIDRNDDAKDYMRLAALNRRRRLNSESKV